MKTKSKFPKTKKNALLSNQIDSNVYMLSKQLVSFNFELVII